MHAERHGEPRLCGGDSERTARSPTRRHTAPRGGSVASPLTGRSRRARAAQPCVLLELADPRRAEAPVERVEAQRLRPSPTISALLAAVERHGADAVPRARARASPPARRRGARPQASSRGGARARRQPQLQILVEGHSPRAPPRRTSMAPQRRARRGARARCARKPPRARDFDTAPSDARERAAPREGAEGRRSRPLRPRTGARARCSPPPRARFRGRWASARAEELGAGGGPSAIRPRGREPLRRAANAAGRFGWRTRRRAGEKASWPVVSVQRARARGARTRTLRAADADDAAARPRAAQPPGETQRRAVTRTRS